MKNSGLMIYPKFYLKTKEEEIPVPINMIVNYDGTRLKMTTGIKVLPRLWNETKQRIRVHGAQLDLMLCNEQLEKWELNLKAAYKEFEDRGEVPSPAILKANFLKHLKSGFIHEEPVQTKTFWEYFDDFIEEKKRLKVSNDVIKDYNNSLRKHLMNFEKRLGVKFDLESFKNDNRCYGSKFEEYLSLDVPTKNGLQGLAVNSVGKIIKNLKAFLNDSFAKGLVVPYSLKHLRTTTEEVDAIYLTSKEVETLYQAQMPDIITEAVRDLFVVGCDTGLRFSDYSRIRKDHFYDGKIRINQKKTKDPVVIPVSTRVKSILEKHNYEIPCPKFVTEFNKYLRQVAKVAGLDQPCKVSSAKFRHVGQHYLPKYELVTSHTARRSFCTNMYLKDVRAELIMKISGHKTQRAFLRYLKLDNETAANELAAFID